MEGQVDHMGKRTEIGSCYDVDQNSAMSLRNVGDVDDFVDVMPATYAVTAVTTFTAWLPHLKSDNTKRSSWEKKKKETSEITNV